jgi:hypothetical protein
MAKSVRPKKRLTRSPGARLAAGVIKEGGRLRMPSAMRSKPARRQPDDPVQLKFRLTEGLRKKLEEAAVTNGRSINSEMIDRLERSFEMPSNDLRKVIEDTVAATLRIRGGTVTTRDIGPTGAPVKDNEDK